MKPSADRFQIWFDVKLRVQTTRVSEIRSVCLLGRHTPSVDIAIASFGEPESDDESRVTLVKRRLVKRANVTSPSFRPLA